jgi:hypothetical protein
LIAGVAALSAQGADLSKIERTIAKEPLYKTKPQYCLLAFGPKAETRVWLVHDGDTLYIDRNGNGDLTETGENVAWKRPYVNAGAITGSDGKSKLQVWLKKYPNSVSITVVESATKRYTVGDPDGDPLVFAERASEAPVAHIGGVSSVELSYYRLGADAMALRVRVATPGLGKGSFAARVLSAVKPPVIPIAEIEFSAQKQGARPIVTKATLKNY